jgi:hypothetical protein
VKRQLAVVIVVDWSRYFRISYDRTKLPRISEKNESPEQLEDVPLAAQIAMYFQHDGAPPSYTRLVMQNLNHFPDRWIGRRSTINWLPRTPDLTPLDFCL